MNDSVFTKIIHGEIPAHMVHEDDYTIALMDIRPIVPGMVVVTTKKQIENFEDLDDEQYAALWRTVKQVAQKIRHVFPDCLKVGVRVEGFEVPHAHVIVMPLSSEQDFRKQPNSSPADQDELSELARKLSF